MRTTRPVAGRVDVVVASPIVGPVRVQLPELPEAGPFEMYGGRLFVADDPTEPGDLTHHLVQTGRAQVLLDPVSALLVHHFFQARAGKDVAAAVTREGSDDDAPWTLGRTETPD